MPPFSLCSYFRCRGGGSCPRVESSHRLRTDTVDRYNNLSKCLKLSDLTADAV